MICITTLYSFITLHICGGTVLHRDGCPGEKLQRNSPYMEPRFSFFLVGEASPNSTPSWVKDLSCRSKACNSDVQQNYRFPDKSSRATYHLLFQVNTVVTSEHLDSSGLCASIALRQVGAGQLECFQ